MLSFLLISNHSKHLFVINLPEKTKITRDDLILKLRERNIGASVHYMPLHNMNYYKHLSKEAKLPVCEKVFASILTLPISASMDLKDADYVINELLSLLNA